MVLILVLLTLFGAALIISGILFSIYPASVRRLFIKRESKKYLKEVIVKLENIVTPSQRGKVYKLYKVFIEKMNINLPVERLMLAKWASLLIGAILVTSVSITNLQINKDNILGSWWRNGSIGQSLTVEEYKYNSRLYKLVLTDIGERKMKELDRQGKLREMQAKLSKYDKGTLDSLSKADALLKTYERYESVSVFNVKVVAGLITFFFLPEIVLLIRKLVIGRKYKMEAIKMENVFELLAGIKDFKTSLILHEMVKVSSINKAQLEKAVSIFNTDKNEGLDNLRKVIPDSKFYDLVDAIRVYSTADKDVALQILERSRREREEKKLLTAEEDMDFVDIIAFTSVVPLLYELCNMMIKPMLDLVFKTFNYI